MLFWGLVDYYLNQGLMQSNWQKAADFSDIIQNKKIEEFLTARYGTAVLDIAFKFNFFVYEVTSDKIS